MKKINDWYVYVAECADTTLYTGVAKDVAKRIDEHNAGNKCKYTRSRRPVKSVYKERHPGKGSALKREAEIKKLTREEKLILIGGD